MTKMTKGMRRAAKANARRLARKTKVRREVDGYRARATAACARHDQRRAEEKLAKLKALALGPSVAEVASS